MELDKLIKDEINKLVSEFLTNSEEYEVSLPLLPISEYAEILSELGFSTLSESDSTNLMDDGNDWDTNGWQVDFWWTIFRNKERFILRGSLFYGGITLCKEDEEDEEDEE